MYVAGIDGHATYLVVVVVNKAGELVQEATRIANQNAHELVELLERFRPLEAVVETSPAWPLAARHAHGERIRVRAGAREEAAGYCRSQLQTGVRWAKLERPCG
jgi:hypothetical protein